MIKKILRQFGYIHKDELIKQAVDIYIDHSKSVNDEKEFTMIVETAMHSIISFQNSG